MRNPNHAVSINSQARWLPYKAVNQRITVGISKRIVGNLKHKRLIDNSGLGPNGLVGNWRLIGGCRIDGSKPVCHNDGGTFFGIGLPNAPDTNEVLPWLHTANTK